MHEETERRILEAEHERRTEELEAARRLQLAMLPQTAPEVPGVDLAFRMVTATEVGGDYVDFRIGDPGRDLRPDRGFIVRQDLPVQVDVHLRERDADAGPVEVMSAVFPGGTITGCPKVRCMEIIAELEGEGRGFYTGSMGYLDRSGNLDLNILIRSMHLHGRQFSFRTGAGIVADSVPEHEVQETADKARGMLLAVETHGREEKHA